MANLKDLIVNGTARIIGKTYSSEFVGNVTGNVTGNLTGDVTGNVSGSSGSCTGNAATASKLKTAVSLTTTDGTHTSDGVSFDGSSATSVKLPKTISATFSGDLTGNVTGSVSGNAGTATKLKTARSLKITDDGTNTSTGVDFDGSDAVTLKLPSTIKASLAGNATTATTASEFVAELATAATDRYVYFAYDDPAYNNSNASSVTKGRAVVDSDFKYNPGTSTLTVGTFKGNLAASNITGTLGVGHGGTGIASFTAGDILYASGTSTLATLNKGTDGQVLKLSGGKPAWGTDNTPTKFAWTNGTTAGPTGSLTGNGMSAVNFAAIPSASESASGIVTTGTQAFAGAKTFADTTDSTNNTSGAVIVSGGLGVAGNIYAGAVYGAVWNDLSDSIPVDDDCDLEHGYCYCFDGEKYSKSSKYLDDGIIGIHSDTYGFKMGAEEGKKKMDVAVSGFVLAYVDKEYKPGTPLTCTKNGYLTKIKLRDKIRYPEKIIATYWKSEPADELGSGSRKVKVNGRKWVKVK